LLHATSYNNFTLLQIIKLNKKQLKGKEVQNKAKYCNAIWVRVGKSCHGRLSQKGKNNRLAWCAADPEQMGKVIRVSLTQDS